MSDRFSWLFVGFAWVNSTDGNCYQYLVFWLFVTLYAKSTDKMPR
ncbi:hypothetical protein VL20_318 [Microcystis panniformis FACHB-1757]|uniref:Uncharacterized protein n=1 Tax=Microcystis panniformis FACHB-1757 TaxID=1638788 RepID=A0A0K1RUH3_9CHRO|nr:hypothetical protein VL20_318 [Microcystis panniformis FACHB-1757]